MDYLADKIIKGGGGVWGETAMAAHPQLTKADVVEIVNYILSVGDVKENKLLPLNGSFTTRPEGGTKGVYILHASYTDRGANGLPPVTAEQTMVLRNPTMMLGNSDSESDVQKFAIPNGPKVVIGSKVGSYVGFDQLDLTGITAISFSANAPANYGMMGGKVEVHIDSPEGKKIGESELVVAKEILPGSANTGGGQVLAKLDPVEGKHNLYFVFHSDTAKPGQSLFTLVSATMIGK
jgi:cytochrome c